MKNYLSLIKFSHTIFALPFAIIGFFLATTQIQNPIEIHKFKNKLEITRKLNQVIEEMVMRNPNQWIWTHDRWK